ncbi:MAG: Fe-S cluster assembly protein SufD [Ignavibacteria bacterium]
MSEVPDKTNITDYYYSGFKLFEDSLNGQLKTKVHQLRNEAIKDFSRLGFPAVSNEEWKYTNIKPILKVNFKPAQLADKTTGMFPAINSNTVKLFLIPELKVNLIVFVNGVYNSELSNIPSELTGIKIESLADILKGGSDFITEKIIPESKINDGFAALNKAFTSDGAIVTVADNAVIDEPVHLMFLSGSDSENLLVQPHNYIFAGRNSRVKIIESFHSISENANLINSLSEIFIEENARITHYKIQNDSADSGQVNRTQVYQQRSSVFTSFAITFDGALVRNDIYTVFQGEGGESHLYGLYLANGKSHIDNHTMIDHAAARCQSNEFYKGILDDHARGVFNGKVMVRRDAQKTLAYQSNKNLLLSKFARVDTKPQLEIFADDVKCSHGATVGQLNDESVFYLRSRGIGADMARSILINAFASDIIDQIDIEPLREYLNNKILDKLNKV